MSAAVVTGIVRAGGCCNRTGKVRKPRYAASVASCKDYGDWLWAAASSFAKFCLASAVSCP
jgi:hypothetical protein